jgi:hypothetical protein
LQQLRGSEILQVGEWIEAFKREGLEKILKASGEFGGLIACR